MKYLLCGVCLLAIYFFGIVKVDPFTKELLLPCTQGREVSLNYEEFHKIVAKPLKYLAHGSKAIAFVSADDTYVIKFFFSRHIYTKSYLSPLKRIRQLLHKPLQLTEGDTELRRYEQALHLLPEATAMVAIHRYKSLEKLPICTLIDYQGIKGKLDLNDVAFVVQKRGAPVKKMAPEERIRLAPKFHDLFVTLSNKGFVNLSKSFSSKNFALLDDKAIMIDLGSLEYIPESSARLEEASFLHRYSHLFK